MNDIVINSRKISKFKNPKGNGHGKGQEQDEAYSREEIQKMLNVAPLRMKVCILIYASTGIRKSALPSLQLRHLDKIDEANLYNLLINPGEKEQYLAFCSPECAKTIDEYLDYRRRLGEILTPESYLIREDFDINDMEQIRSKSRSISHRTIGANFHAISIKAGIRERSEDQFARKRVPLFHGFRKFFTTQLINSKLDPEKREMLLGHTIGLTGAYYRPSEDDLLYREPPKACARCKSTYWRTQPRRKTGNTFRDGKYLWHYQATVPTWRAQHRTGTLGIALDNCHCKYCDKIRAGQLADQTGSKQENES